MSDDLRIPDEQHAAQLARAYRHVFNTEDGLAVLRDLAIQFNVNSPSFQSGDGFNPHAAAQRDGQRAMFNYILTQSNKNKNG